MKSSTKVSSSSAPQPTNKIEINIINRLLLYPNQFWLYAGGPAIQFYASSDSTPHTMIQLGSRITLKALNGSIHQLQIRNTADSDYLPVVASEFVTSSRKEMKKNIESYTGDALKEIRNIPFYLFHRLTDDDRELKRLGIMYEESPSLIVDPSGNGVSDYAMNVLNMRAIQQLDLKDQEFESELEKLKTRVLELEQQLAEYKNTA
ncbi:hypothetical protein ACWE42_24455 [Sutcliffiella cohnii]